MTQSECEAQEEGGGERRGRSHGGNLAHERDIANCRIVILRGAVTTPSLSPTTLRLDLRSRTGAGPATETEIGPTDPTRPAVPALRGRIEGVPDVGLEALREARASRPGTPHFYWEDPEGGIAIGWGAAAWFHGHGAGRFEEARSWIREIAAAATLTGAPRGPRPETYLVAAGGFAFRADGGWGSGFDGATFVVPRVLLHLRRDVGPVRIVWSRENEPDDGIAADAPPPRAGVPEMPCGALEESLADREVWEGAVRDAIAGIADGAIEKVVLARHVSEPLPIGFDPFDLLARLRERQPGCYHYLFDFGQDALLLGASPERLVTVRGVRVFSDAVAGTAPRPAEPRAEAEAVARLRASAKDQWEHAIVVRHIQGALAPFTTELTVDELPEVQRLRKLLHLRTRIAGKAPLGTHVLSLAERLHPTPAVAGSPRDAALAWIAEREPGDRGWYAGAVGWMTAGGDGDFAVALRGAFVSGRRALLGAGAGIVAGSEPERELDETERKFRSFLDALRWG
ncbi:MAG TPA: isochorismate synthase [Candidatus Eisenbacteria bacterium]|nr:isochorismate synthase [Candidatus Eisenbacteria bacterium]